MPHANFEPSESLFGTKLQEALDKKSMQIRDASDLIGSTYEYMRKMVRGQALPSKYMLRTLCDKLGMDFDEAERLVAADHMQKKHGGIPMELAGISPELEPFQRGWVKLTKDQKNHLLTTLRTFLTHNRRSATSVA